MRLIDSHCHPQFPQYDNDRDMVIRHALEKGIGMIGVGTDLETSKEIVVLADRYEGLWASVGLHPNDNLDEQYDSAGYERLVSSSPNVIAIGEIGLDYYRTEGIKKQSLQKARFLEQLQLAERLGLPVIIHCRDAHDDMIKILRDREVRGVVHSFTGTAAQAAAYVDIGMHVGFNGILTFTDQYNEAVRAVPLDRMLVETDAPFLAPVPYRGKRNEPAYVIEVAKKLALLKKEGALINATKVTTCKLFHIPYS